MVELYQAVETIGFLLLSAVGVTTIGGFAVTAATASIVGTAAFLAITVGLQFLLGQPSGAELPKGQDGSQALRQPIPPRLYAYGRCRIGGYYMLHEVRNGEFAGVIALITGRTCAYIQFYLHDDLANVMSNGVVTGAVGATDERYAAPSYMSYAIVFRVRYGMVPETAHEMITARMPDIWNSAHRGDGISSIAMVCAVPKAEEFSKVYPQQLPNLSVVADWLPVYDPRNPNQDRLNDNTLGPSYNPVLQLIDFVTSKSHGLGFDYDTCIAPVLADLMNEAGLCDQMVEKADGSFERRYQSSGFWTSQNEPASVTDALMSSCDGWFGFNGDGTLTVFVGVYRPPQVTITQDNIYSFEVSAGVEDENAVNVLEWTFTDPDNKYRDAPGLAWRDDADILERGTTRSQTIPLTWVQSHSQGRRLAKRKFARLNPIYRGTITTDLFGIAALRERWIRIQDDRHPWLSDTVVEISKVTIDVERHSLTFEWASINPNEIDAWDASAEEGYQPSRGDDNPTDTLPVPAGLTGSYSGGTITIVFADLHRPDLSYVVRWRIGAGAWSEIDVGSGVSNGTTTTIAPGGFTSGNTYELQVASVGSQGTHGAWSASLTQVT